MIIYIFTLQVTVNSVYHLLEFRHPRLDIVNDHIKSRYPKFLIEINVILADVIQRDFGYLDSFDCPRSFQLDVTIVKDDTLGKLVEFTCTIAKLLSGRRCCFNPLMDLRMFRKHRVRHRIEMNVQQNEQASQLQRNDGKKLSIQNSRPDRADI